MEDKNDFINTKDIRFRPDKVNPAISVVIPVYNQEKYVGKCIRSVLSQSFQDFEIILVNDGSTDKSLKICQRYVRKDNRITILDKQNQGVALARKDGFLNAKGDYICFLDSDDYLAIGALGTLYKLAEESGVDLVIGNNEKVFDNWGLVKKKSVHFREADKMIDQREVIPFFLAYGGGYSLATNVVLGRLYRRNCIMRAYKESFYPLFPQIAPLEDCVFNLVIAPFLKSVRVLDVVVYHYRYGGVTSRYCSPIRKGTLFYDIGFGCYIRYGCGSLLPSLLKVYSYMLMNDVLGQVHFHVCPDEETREFVRRELEERKIVLWARDNLDKLPEKMNKERLISSVLNKDIDEFLAMVNEREIFLQIHHYWKMTLLKIYSKMANGIANIII